MLRSFPASSSGEGSRSCPSSHTAPAASHALQASKGHAERRGGDTKRHGQKPRLKRDVSRAESLQIHPDRAGSCFWLLVGGRDLAPLITQTEKPSLHHHHTVSGESRSLTESEPCRLCRAARALPHPGDSAALLPRWKTVQEQTGRTGFPFPTQCFVVLVSFHQEVCTIILPPRGRDRGSPAPPQTGFTEALKPGRASPAGKGFLASTMCWGQTPGQLCPEWTLALKTMMEMSRSYRDALLMVLPHTEHAGATELWMHGSVSYPLWVVILGEGSPVFAHRKVRIRGRDPRSPSVPGFPTTTTKDNRGTSSHL